MKKLHAILLITFSCFGLQHQINAQCEPDMINCIDTGVPGQICPLILPDGIIDQAYEQVVTIIPPYEFDLGEGAIEIVKIIIKQIDSLPPGLTYEANAEEFYADSVYCVLLNGTPTTEGIYNLGLHIIPFINYLGTPVEMPVQIDDTSLTITILTSSVDEIILDHSKLLASPNPFSSDLYIEFFSQTSEISELNIFDFQGKLVYQNYFATLKGSNEIEYKGENLKNGIYFITVQNNHQFIRQKIIKLN